MSFSKVSTAVIAATLACTVSMPLAAAATERVAPRLAPASHVGMIGTHLIPVAEASQRTAAPTEYALLSAWPLLAVSLLIGTMGVLALRRFVRHEQQLHTRKLF